MTETTATKVREEQVTDLTAENAHRVTMVREKGTDHPPVPFHFRKEHHGMHHFVHLYGNPEDRNELRSSNFKDWEEINDDCKGQEGLHINLIDCPEEISS